MQLCVVAMADYTEANAANGQKDGGDNTIMVTHSFLTQEDTFSSFPL